MIPDVAIYATSNRVLAEAVSDGIAAIGLKSRLAMKRVTMAHVSIMLFGPKTGKRNAFRQNIVNYHRLHNIPWIVVEGGFTRPPLVQQKYHGIGWKGIAGHGHHLVENAPSDRFEKLGLDVKPWKTDRSGPVLLCGQIPNDANIYYVDYSNWFRSTCNELKSLGVNYKVRFHPRLKGIKQKD